MNERWKIDVSNFGGLNVESIDVCNLGGLNVESSPCDGNNEDGKQFLSLKLIAIFETTLNAELDFMIFPRESKTGFTVYNAQKIFAGQTQS